MSLGFPPFPKAVKWLVVSNGIIFLTMAVLGRMLPTAAAYVEAFGYLRAATVLHGFPNFPIPAIWQLVTYAFFHAGLFHILFNMLALWMFGAQFEMDWGTRRFVEFYFFCVIGAALVSVIFGATGFLGLSPITATVGSSGGIYGILLAFGILYAYREIMLFPLPFLIKAKYFVIGLIFIALYGTLSGPGGVAYVAHLGGLLFGYIYLKLWRGHGILGGMSERYFGMRNSYYRWKRRRAARKFEVYMRKHDRSEYFDQYGNYRDPKDPSTKGDGDHHGPWVN
jgi:membrane associated rhomboid family serine protease